MSTVTHNLSSFFNSLQASASKKTGVVNFWVTYTYGKTMAYNCENPFNERRCYGPAPFDRSQNLNISYLINLPNVSAKHLGNHAALNALLDGWQFTGIESFGSGNPLEFTGTASAGGNTGNEYDGFHNRTISMTSAGPGYPNLDNRVLVGTPDEQAVPTLVCDPRANLHEHQYFNASCFRHRCQAALVSRVWERTSFRTFTVPALKQMTSVSTRHSSSQRSGASSSVRRRSICSTIRGTRSFNSTRVCSCLIAATVRCRWLRLDRQQATPLQEPAPARLSSKVSCTSKRTRMHWHAPYDTLERANASSSTSTYKTDFHSLLEEIDYAAPDSPYLSLPDGDSHPVDALSGTKGDTGSNDSIAVDASGNIWGPGNGFTSVVEISPLGATLKTMTLHASAAVTGGYAKPLNITVSPTGTI